MTEEQFNALTARVAVIEEREQMPLAYQREAHELAAALDNAQMRTDTTVAAGLERLGVTAKWQGEINQEVEQLVLQQAKLEWRMGWLELPWWKRILGWRPQ